MALEGKTEQEIQQLETTLLNRLPQNGDPAGNVTLLRDLGWDENAYWEVRDRLVNRGLLQLGRGRGGSVRRIIPAAVSELAGQGPVANTLPPAREADLYEPIARVLRERWVKDKRFRDYIVEITARQGARNTGGTWTRPDVTVIGITVLPFFPGKTFDVVTFEIKPQEAVDVTAVYEALAHLRAATRSYVIFQVAADRREGLKEVIDRAVEEAKRHGIGVIVASEPGDYETWDRIVEGDRHEPVSPIRPGENAGIPFSIRAK